MRDVAIYSPFAWGLYSRIAGAIGGGGAELQTVLLARGLAGRGIDVAHVVYPVRNPVPQEPPAPTIVERSAESSGRLRFPREAAGVWRGLSEADARVVIVRGSGGYVVPAAAWARVHRRAFVFSASNDLDFDFHRPDRSRTTLGAYARALRLARTVVAQTQRQAELARSAAPGMETVVIPSFAEPAEKTGGAPKYFLWSDRMTGYKRPEPFLDLAAAMPEARFVMVASETGETSPELRRTVHARAAQLSNLELLPRCSRPELLDLMAEALAIVKTSEVEGMPNTFLEAWARSIPVLSLSVDPDRRIADQGLGLLANGSADRFVEQARELWTDAALRAEIGARGREFVRANHSVEAVTDRWEATLRPMLRQPAR